MNEGITLRTVGIHPYTDLIYLHSLLEGLRRYRLLPYAWVEPVAGYHIIGFSGIDKGEVIESITQWVLDSLLEAVTIDPVVAEGLVRYGDDVIDRGVLRREVTEWVASSRSPPYTVRDLVKVAGPVGRRKERTVGLIKDLRRIGIDLAKITRSILIIPHIGKHKFAPDDMRKIPKTEPIEPIPGIILYSGLKLVGVRVISVGSGSRGIELSLVGPSAKVSAEDVWRAQAELRYRSDLDPLHGLVDGFYMGRGFVPEAAGILVSAVMKPVRGSFGVAHVKAIRSASMKIFVGTKVLIRKRSEREIKELSNLRDIINKVTVVSLRAESLGGLPSLISIYEYLGGPVGGLIDLVRSTADDIVLRNLLYLGMRRISKTALYRLMKQLLIHLANKSGGDVGRALVKVGALGLTMQYLMKSMDEVVLRVRKSPGGSVT